MVLITLQFVCSIFRNFEFFLVFLQKNYTYIFQYRMVQKLWDPLEVLRTAYTIRVYDIYFFLYLSTIALPRYSTFSGVKDTEPIKYLFNMVLLADGHVGPTDYKFSFEYPLFIYRSSKILVR